MFTKSFILQIIRFASFGRIVSMKKSWKQHKGINNVAIGCIRIQIRSLCALKVLVLRWNMKRWNDKCIGGDCCVKVQVDSWFDEVVT